GAAAHRATLAGSAIPSTAVLLFPGAAPVGYDTDRLEPDPTSAIIDLGTSGPVNLTTRISDRGATAATEAATSAMRRCLSAPTVDPGCPLDPAGSRSVPGTLRGTVTSTSVSQPPALVDDDRDGLVEVQGRFTVLGSWLTLDFDNIAARRSGSTSVSFRLRVYVTGATAVSWMGP
ncbi:MAG: hypothetical protein M3140_03545, partial [Actinomycetota bacterium]|nr:hypothetical protein [Actinomycetota bacterium]